MKKKMMKALRDLNAYIDNDREKLSDRIHELELSHKRMERLLRFVVRVYDETWPDNETMDAVIYKIKVELSNPYLRHNWKLKGGKHA